MDSDILRQYTGQEQQGVRYNTTPKPLGTSKGLQAAQTALQVGNLALQGAELVDAINTKLSNTKAQGFQNYINGVMNEGENNPDFFKTSEMKQQEDETKIAVIEGNISKLKGVGREALATEEEERSGSTPFKYIEHSKITEEEQKITNLRDKDYSLDDDYSNFAAQAEKKKQEILKGAWGSNKKQLEVQLDAMIIDGQRIMDARQREYIQAVGTATAVGDARALSVQGKFTLATESLNDSYRSGLISTERYQSEMQIVHVTQDKQLQRRIYENIKKDNQGISPEEALTRLKKAYSAIDDEQTPGYGVIGKEGWDASAEDLYNEDYNARVRKNVAMDEAARMIINPAEAIVSRYQKTGQAKDRDSMSATYNELVQGVKDGKYNARVVEPYLERVRAIEAGIQARYNADQKALKGIEPEYDVLDEKDMWNALAYKNLSKTGQYKALAQFEDLVPPEVYEAGLASIENTTEVAKDFRKTGLTIREGIMNDNRLDSKEKAERIGLFNDLYRSVTKDMTEMSPQIAETKMAELLTFDYENVLKNKEIKIKKSGWWSTSSEDVTKKAANSARVIGAQPESTRFEVNDYIGEGFEYINGRLSEETMENFQPGPISQSEVAGYKLLSVGTDDLGQTVAMFDRGNDVKMGEYGGDSYAKDVALFTLERDGDSYKWVQVAEANEDIKAVYIDGATAIGGIQLVRTKKTHKGIYYTDTSLNVSFTAIGKLYDGYKQYVGDDEDPDGALMDTVLGKAITQNKSAQQILAEEGHALAKSDIKDQYMKLEHVRAQNLVASQQQPNEIQPQNYAELIESDKFYEIDNVIANLKSRSPKDQNRVDIAKESMKEYLGLLKEKNKLPSNRSGLARKSEIDKLLRRNFPDVTVAKANKVLGEHG